MTLTTALQHASPEAVAHAIGTKFAREYADDASRLADLVVAAVQKELRK